MDKNQSHHDGARVHAITDAQEAASIEAKHRMRSYAVKMALRAIFFVAGAIIAATWNIWVGVALLAISAVLPWVAVMDANLIANPEVDDSATFIEGPPADQLPGGASPSEHDGGASGSSDAPGSGAAAGDGHDDTPEAGSDVIPGSFEPDAEPEHPGNSDDSDAAGEPDAGDTRA